MESSNTSDEFLGFEEERELNQSSDTTADDFREKSLDENENETTKRPLHTNQSSCENSKFDLFIFCKKNVLHNSYQSMKILVQSNGIVK